jgi:hypothetical protein
MRHEGTKTWPRDRLAPTDRAGFRAIKKAEGW